MLLRPNRALRWLIVVPLLWLGCRDGESLNPTPTSTTSSTTRPFGEGGYGGFGGFTTSSTSATGGTSNSGGGGATTSSTSSSSSTTTSSSSSTTTSSSSSTTTSSSSSTTTSSSSSTTTSSSSTTTTSSSSSTSGTGGGPAGTRVRLVASNLTSGNGQSYDPGHGIRILQGVHGDVILMQEMNYGANTDADLRALADAVCGASCALARGGGQIPNGVVSRYPILASGAWTDPKVGNRDFAWARIDVPGPVDLWAVSVHLLTSNAGERNAEAAALIAQLQANVPAGDYVVVGGDFNTDARTEAALTTFSARLSVGAPYPADGKGNSSTNSTRSKPYDWVLPSPELRAREDAVRLGASVFATGLVVDTRVYTPIAEIAPALSSDSDASSMQHMGVVRDFLLQ